MKYTEIDPETLKMPMNRILVRKDKPKAGTPWKEHGESKILVANGTETGEKDPGNIVEVVSCGPEVVNKHLQVLVEDSDVAWKEGCDHSIFLIHQPFSGFDFSHGDYDYKILSEQDVLGVI